MALFVSGVLFTLIIEAIVYAIYKSERKDALIADKLDVEFEEGISLKKKKKNG